MADEKELKSLLETGMKAFSDKDYQKSEEKFTELLEKEPDFRLAWQSRGASRLRLERIDEALSDLNKAVEMAPERSRAYHLRALVHERKGELDQAIADCGRAIERDPEYAAAYHSRYLLRMSKGEEGQAQEDLQMFNHLTEKQLEEFANEHNVWRSAHLAVEEEGLADVMVDR